MSEQDKEYLRDLVAMFAMNGMLSSGLRDYSVAKTAYKMADEMLEARNAISEEDGILAIKPKKKPIRKG
jgi:hypothetical protein